MWPRKTKPKPDPKRIPIPLEHRRRIMELVRDYERAPAVSRSWETYLMWEAISEVVPEVARGSWSLTVGQPLSLSVVEML